VGVVAGLTPFSILLRIVFIETPAPSARTTVSRWPFSILLRIVFIETRSGEPGGCGLSELSVSFFGSCSSKLVSGSAPHCVTTFQYPSSDRVHRNLAADQVTIRLVDFQYPSSDRVHRNSRNWCSSGPRHTSFQYPSSDRVHRNSDPRLRATRSLRSFSILLRIVFIETLLVTGSTAKSLTFQYPSSDRVHRNPCTRRCTPAASVAFSILLRIVFIETGPAAGRVSRPAHLSVSFFGSCSSKRRSRCRGKGKVGSAFSILLRIVFIETPPTECRGGGWLRLSVSFFGSCSSKQRGGVVLCR